MSIVRITNVFQRLALSFLFGAVLICSPTPTFAQTTDSPGDQSQEAQATSGSSASSDQASEDQQQPSTQPTICGVTHLGQCLKDIGHDQAGIWTSPLRVRTKDVFWLVPFAAILLFYSVLSIAVSVTRLLRR